MSCGRAAASAIPAHLVALGAAGGGGEGARWEPYPELRARYSFAPRPERYSRPPPHLRLRHVLVVARHGDRAPIAQRCGALDGLPWAPFWALQLPAAAPAPWAAWCPVWRPQGGEDGDRGEAPFAQLTALGAQECRELGAVLRQRYALDGEQRLLPEVLSRPGAVEAVASPFLRTQHSAANILLGLYPPEAREPGSRGVWDAGGRCFFGVEQTPVLVRGPAAETLIPNADGRCGHFEELLAAAERRLHEARTPEHEALEAQVAEAVLHPHPEREGIYMLDFQDLGICHLARQLERPRGVTASLVDAVVSYNAWRWHCLYSEAALCRLAVGRLVHDVVASALEARDPSGQRGPQLRLFVGHDSTLIPLLCALGIHDATWPPFSSALVLEVAEGPYGSWAVRALFNDEERCLFEGQAPWVSLDKFEHHLRWCALSREAYEEECER